MQESGKEKGTVVILSLLIIMLLAVMGIWAAKMSTTETRMARNDKLYKSAFYGAESGTEAGLELLEQNIEQRGFTQDASGDCTVGGLVLDTGDADQRSLRFYMNSALLATEQPGCTSAERDFFFPRANAPCSPPITNVRVGGNPSLSSGSAIQMASGYEGKGKGAAGGGGWITYDIRARHRGYDNSEATINLRWRHVL
jgi:Tfp pilus assembly protein PilX